MADPQEPLQPPYDGVNIPDEYRAVPFDQLPHTIQLRVIHG